MKFNVLTFQLAGCFHEGFVLPFLKLFIFLAQADGFLVVTWCFFHKISSMFLDFSLVLLNLLELSFWCHLFFLLFLCLLLFLRNQLAIDTIRAQRFFLLHFGLLWLKIMSEVAAVSQGKVALGVNLAKIFISGIIELSNPTSLHWLNFIV